MPYNPDTNKWDNTTGKLNKERTWIEKDFSKMSDEQLLKEARKPRPITDHCALTVLVWIHIKMKSEGVQIVA